MGRFTKAKMAALAAVALGASTIFTPKAQANPLQTLLRQEAITQEEPQEPNEEPSDIEIIAAQADPEILAALATLHYVSGFAHHEIWGDTDYKPQDGEIPATALKITFTNTATGQVFTTTTDQQGNYTLTGLPPGNYSYTIDGNSTVGKTQPYYFAQERQPDGTYSTVAIRDLQTGKLMPRQIQLETNALINWAVSEGPFRPLISPQRAKESKGTEIPPFSRVDLNPLEGQVIDGNGNTKDDQGIYDRTTRCGSDLKTQHGAYDGHSGLDFCTGIGDLLPALTDGVVNRIGTINPYGFKYIEIKTLIQTSGRPITFKWQYQHITKAADGLNVGDQVRTGQIIAEAGHSGVDPRVPHTHFEVYVDSQLKDPLLSWLLPEASAALNSRIENRTGNHFTVDLGYLQTFFQAGTGK